VTLRQEKRNIKQESKLDRNPLSPQWSTQPSTIIYV